MHYSEYLKVFAEHYQIDGLYLEAGPMPNLRICESFDGLVYRGWRKPCMHSVFATFLLSILFPLTNCNLPWNWDAIYLTLSARVFGFLLVRFCYVPYGTY